MNGQTVSIRNLAAIHLAGNALLLWLMYYWLGVGETRAATLLWSAFLAILLAGAACWLHGAAFACFRGAELPKAMRLALRHLLPVFVAAVAVAILYALVAQWAEYSRTPGLKIASYLTLKLRKPVKPASVMRIFDTVLWLVRWMVLPVFLLPVVSGAASRGWAGFGEIGRMARSWRFWIATPVLLVCAFWLPLKVIVWAPHMSKFSLEMASFIIRLLVAYLLLVGSWLLLAFFTAGGIPTFTHSKRAPSP